MSGARRLDHTYLYLCYRVTLTFESRGLAHATDRGVRVRLLLGHNSTAGLDTRIGTSR
jgi:hypothetical protein